MRCHSCSSTVQPELSSSCHMYLVGRLLVTPTVGVGLVTYLIATSCIQMSLKQSPCGHSPDMQMPQLQSSHHSWRQQLPQLPQRLLERLKQKRLHRHSHQLSQHCMYQSLPLLQALLLCSRPLTHPCLPQSSHQTQQLLQSQPVRLCHQLHHHKLQHHQLHHHQLHVHLQPQLLRQHSLCLPFRLSLDQQQRLKLWQNLSCQNHHHCQVWLLSCMGHHTQTSKMSV